MIKLRRTNSGCALVLRKGPPLGEPFLLALVEIPGVEPGQSGTNSDCKRRLVSPYG